MDWKKVASRSGLALLCLLIVATLSLAIHEARTSHWQSSWLSSVVGQARFAPQPGPSERIHFPEAGPFDRRLGYALIPEFTQRLHAAGFDVTAQAQWSERMEDLHRRGLFVPYREKTRAGLELQGCRGDMIYSARFPERVYEGFADVPPVVRDMLVHVENRRLFDPEPRRNPAVEWARLGRAVVDQLRQYVDPSHSGAGGSTLATQIEKYRHSPGGFTSTPRDKLGQMLSASLRSYLDGPDTMQRRQQIVVDYLNTVPLSANAGYGEVIGFGEALWVWYGQDFDRVNRLLRQIGTGEADAVTPEQALALKQALSLVVAQRRPSHYLSQEGLDDLRGLTDAHLRLLSDAGIVPPALRDAALPLPLQLRRRAPEPDAPAFVEAKAASDLRNRLQHLLGVPGVYDLDRLDLRAGSSYASDLQQQATALLRSLGTPEGARAAGLYGPYLLGENDDPSRIAYSFTLYESDGRRNMVRIQTDNLDRPFDLTAGARLDLGSTAKLRTLVTYLEQVAALHARWHALTPAQLAALQIRPEDAISLWARQYLRQAPDRSLAAMLDASMQRTYSANPGERFVTGGGVHSFGNFQSRHNNEVMTLQKAMTDSVNLPFIRLMRDMARHVVATDPAIDPTILDDPADPRRRAYLALFADREGSGFVSRFHRKYASLAPQEVEARLMQDVRKAAAPVTNVFFMLHPQGSAEDLRRFLGKWLPEAADAAENLHARHAGWDINDRGYLARTHPLELWVAGYLMRHPGASLTDTLAATSSQRQEVYAWLFGSNRKERQDRRIREQMEIQAFDRIADSWRRLGYPFERITPSYATALGASGDRPSALAEFVGILNNGGLRLPTVRVETLAFAEGTPWETHFARQSAPPQRVLAPEVAATARRAMLQVVEEGTGRRARGAVALGDDTVLPLRGKTGTGDHRQKGRDLDGEPTSRVVSRSATFVFQIGDRFHGTLMAYVGEPHAADYRFTSALPTQVLKTLGPMLAPLVAQPGCGVDESIAGSADAPEAATRDSQQMGGPPRPASP